jgi:hypothetical protein
MLLALCLALGEPISDQVLIDFRVCLRHLTGQTLHDATTLSKASGADELWGVRRGTIPYLTTDTDFFLKLVTFQ